MRNSRISAALRAIGLAAVLVVGPAALAGCASGAAGPGSATATPAASADAGTTAPATAVGIATGDPNAAGRDVDAQSSTTAPAGVRPPDAPVNGAAGGGAMAMCANETLAESMARAVDAGQSVVLATGGFTGSTTTGDGEIGQPFSEVALRVDEHLAGPALPDSLSAWVFGDLGAGTGNGAAVTEEGLSLWAAGGRMIAIVDTETENAGLPGPVVRVAPVVGDDVILSYVGCWTTQGVTVRPFDSAVQIFDDRGLHPSGTELWALALDDFRAALPA